MHDFQFFNREELGELVQEEERLEQRRKDAQSLARELKQKGKKAQDEANAKAKAAGQEPSPCAEAEAHLQQSREVAKELEKGSSYELTGAKLEKKEQLLRKVAPLASCHCCCANSPRWHLASAAAGAAR